MPDPEKQRPPESSPFGQQPDDPPPVLSSWRRLYTVVLVHLAFWIIVFYLFTIRFAA